MQKNNIVQKRKLEVDGEELENLKSVSELKTSKGVVEASSFKRKNDVTDGSQKLEPLTIQFNRNKDSTESGFIYDWYNNDEVKDVVIIITDGSGSEVERWLLEACEVSSYSKGEYDASSPDIMPVIADIVCTGAFSPIE